MIGKFLFGWKFVVPLLTLLACGGPTELPCSHEDGTWCYCHCCPPISGAVDVPPPGSVPNPCLKNKDGG